MLQFESSSVSFMPVLQSGCSRLLLFSAELKYHGCVMFECAHLRGKWSVQTRKQANIHMHLSNAVMLYSLGLTWITPINTLIASTL